MSVFVCETETDLEDESERDFHEFSRRNIRIICDLHKSRSSSLCLYRVSWKLVSYCA